jgi:REP element-mobilizing transposase RayT
MSYTKIYIHAVWATKNRHPYFNSETKQKLIDHIHEYSKTKNIHIMLTNGFHDHLHCLLSLEPEQNIATVMNLLKGESSFWINKNKISKTHFSWQEEYFAVSIGESQLNSVYEYIANQENHHQKKSFQQEYDEFMKNYKFEIEKG